MRALLLGILLLGGGIAQAAEGCPTIVSQSPYITHTLEWMGLKHCIVGTSRYEDLGLPQTGGVLDPDAEAIALLKPEIILSSDWISEQQAQAIRPAGSRLYRLHGFQSMRQIEDNLTTIARAVGLADPQATAERFHRLWREKLARIEGKGRRALLLSACSGAPYSFGKSTWLYDLFSRAGFRVVETEEKIRNINPADLNTLIDELQPQLVFIFERSAAQQCRMITPKTPVRIVPLDGDRLLQPAPILLKGLDELIAKQASWKEI